MPPSTLHKLLNPPSAPYSFHYSPHQSFLLPSCPPTVSVVFFIQFLQNHHHFSLSSSSISFFHSALPLIFSRLCFSPTHHHLNKPCLLPSLTIINRFGLRASMFFFCSSWGARGHINTKASKHCVSVLMHGNSQRWKDFKLPAWACLRLCEQH